MQSKGRVLVTGAGGFIGSHLVEELFQEGYEVKALTYYNPLNSWWWLDSLPGEMLKKIDVISGDLRDPHSMQEALKGCDMVFHLAGLIGIPFSYHSPDLYVDTNVKGTLNILQAARKNKLERVLITSTSEIYGTARYVPIDEEHPRQPQSPYSASKIGAESMAESFYRSFDLPVTIVRPFNTFGPRQSARAVIPTIITQLLNGRSSIELGNLEPTRDFTYVRDTARGFIRIAQCESLIGEYCNIASQREISIGDLANELIRQINPEAEIVTGEKRMRPDKSEVYRLFGSSEKLRSHTSWEAEYTLEEGLRETIDWFRNGHHLKSYKTGIYNI